MLLALLLSSLLGHRIAHDAARTPGAHLDCSGFARAVYAREGVKLTGSVRDIHREARKRHALRKKPRPGDLVFFRNTDPRGGFTHVGIVEKVHQGRVVFIHRSNSGVVRSRLDLRHPRSPKTNDFLRRSPPKLAGELAAGFAAPDKLR